MRVAAVLTAAVLLGGASLACNPLEEDDVTSSGSLRLAELGSFASPTYLGAPEGDERQFVTEREGTVRIVRDGEVLEAPFLDISDSVNVEGEGGLLSIAFPPDYDSSRRFYVYYTDRAGFIQIDQYETSPDDPDRALPDSRRSVLRVPHRRGNHKGGQLQFGPDGLLYAGFGDGGGGGDPDRNAQNLGELLGKIIRIEPRPDGGYDVPQDNPFVDEPGARPEIWAYGLRNPYRFSFDRDSGDMVIADVGQDAVEEIDLVPSGGDGEAPEGGQNFGWSAFEGTQRFNDVEAPGHVPPVLEELQSDGFCSIIGGYVIRDPELGADTDGKYVYGDLCSRPLRLATLGEGETASSEASGLEVSQLVSFGEDSQGRVYAISLDGAVYRLERS